MYLNEGLLENLGRIIYIKCIALFQVEINQIM
jgi:hypothetical protein